MDTILDNNKPLLAQFGGKEAAAREKMYLLQVENVGQFKRDNGRAPTLEEAAKIAKQVMATVASQMTGK